MKSWSALFLTAAWVMFSSHAQAQTEQWGEVNFANSVTFTTPAPNPPGDRLVRESDGTLLTGSDLSQPPTFVAQLYYGPNAGDLVPVTNAPARFRPGPTGLWLGGIRNLPGFLPGQSVVLQVVIWDASCSATFEEANCRGVGQTFSYTPPPHGSPTHAYYMENLSGMTALGLSGLRPTILQQPTNQVSYVGQTVILSVVASNHCRFQWQFNGANLPSGPCEMLRIDDVQLSHAGDYRVVINPSPFVAVTSQVARLTVHLPRELSFPRFNGTAFTFHVSEETGRAVVIESALDLNPATPWTAVFTNTAPFWFTNATPADRQRFYRTVVR